MWVTYESINSSQSIGGSITLIYCKKKKKNTKANKKNYQANVYYIKLLLGVCLFWCILFGSGFRSTLLRFGLAVLWRRCFSFSSFWSFLSTRFFLSIFLLFPNAFNFLGFYLFTWLFFFARLTCFFYFGRYSCLGFLFFWNAEWKFLFEEIYLLKIIRIKQHEMIIKYK